MYLVEPGHLGPESNITLLSNKTVDRVIFEGDRATGVVICDSRSGPLTDPTQRRTLLARKMVILAGGAFGSPMILERSGIGSPSLLRSLSIEVKVDLPGVGAEYQDHEVNRPLPRDSELCRVS